MGISDTYATARSMTAAMRAGEVSARELLDLHLARIEAVNPDVNAVVSLDPDRARRVGPRGRRAAGPR